MTNWESEFNRTRCLIEAEEKASIRLYYNKDSFSNGAMAYVYHYGDDRLPKILLRQGTDINYKCLLYNLLHEYGHVLDRIKWKHADRWNICDKYSPMVASKKLADYPTSIKKKLLLLEYYADEEAKRFACKRKIPLPLDYMNLMQSLNIKTSKYEFMHGQCVAERTYLRWKKEFQSRPKVLLLQDVKNLNKI